MVKYANLAYSSNEFNGFVIGPAIVVQYELGNYRFYNETMNNGNDTCGAGGNLKTLWSFNENHLLNKTELKILIRCSTNQILKLKL
jgi:hypothetical protein